MTIPFADLLPDFILSTVEKTGLQTNGVIYPLSSYENRVYEIQSSEGRPFIAKFYRPGRWVLESLKEEHTITNALALAGVPVVTPLQLNKTNLDATISVCGGYHFCLYEKVKARHQDEFSFSDLKKLGVVLAQMHNVLELQTVKNRPGLDVGWYAEDTLDDLLSLSFLDADLKESLSFYSKKILEYCEHSLKADIDYIPVHGDLHIGNILWQQGEPLLLDFDDFMIAPAFWDIWMLFSGAEAPEQLKVFREGYELYREFDESQLKLTEVFRSMRMIHHAGWIAQRYNESAFQKAFSFFKERKYFEGLNQSLKEQLSLLQNNL